MEGFIKARNGETLILQIAGSPDGIVLLTRDLSAALPAEVVPQFMLELSRREDGATSDTLSLLALPPSATPAPLMAA